MQKKFFKLLHPMMCKNLKKLGFCKKLVGEAMSILQQPGMELFKNFFLHVAFGIIGSNLNAFLVVSTTFTNLLFQN